MLSKKFEFEELRSVSQWKNFKYTRADWEVPSKLFTGKGMSPTEFVLKKIVCDQAILNPDF